MKCIECGRDAAPTYIWWGMDGDVVCDSTCELSRRRQMNVEFGGTITPAMDRAAEVAHARRSSATSKNTLKLGPFTLTWG